MFYYSYLFKTLRPFLPLLLKKYNFQTDRLPHLQEPFLMVANHATESDMLMAMAAVSDPVYFVCGEHLLRGRYGKLIHRVGNPIPLPKGGSSLAAVKEILHRLRQGGNVMLFPEGSRSFNGETLPLQSSLGKLVKKSGAALVTYHIKGGYFVAPRWAYHTRTGPIEGRVTHIYSSSELRTMSAEDITAAINRDLYENAYLSQRDNPKRYCGEGLAEGLENYLILCPRCGSYDSMTTEKNSFRCSHCGLEGVYNEFGFLQGTDLPFDNVYDWGKWIEQRFDQDMAARDAGTPLFTENEILLYEVDPHRHHSRNCLTDTLTVFRDRFEIGSLVFPFSDISSMSMLYYGKTLLFTCSKGYYGMTGPAFHAWKTDRLYRLYQSDSK